MEESPQKSSSISSEEESEQKEADNQRSSDSTKQTEDEMQDTAVNISSEPSVFKKPILLIGPRKGKTVGKLRSVEKSDNVSKPIDSSIEVESSTLELPGEKLTNDIKISLTAVKESKVSPAEKIKDNLIPLPYKEPKWSGVPDSKYTFEVIKSGIIIDNIDLTSKPFFVFGRLSTCDIHMAHPTVSRYHAVLQYRSVAENDNPKGFYIYDLGSTHGTFVNKFQIMSREYVPVKVGHMLKIGNSSRMFILQGPEDDMEEESELTVTELKTNRQLQLKLKELELAEKKREEEELERQRKEKEEKEGVDWGMGEDADEETDLSENPFAAAPNEELYLDDPKKTLRGWFEREGYELEYNVEEKGFGQFLCRVELPVGNTMYAEALVKGKKKEAVVQCALEACRILDRCGLLRQANHESRKRKTKNWEDEDYYDSDDDTFLDRTGVVEKKRLQRMEAAGKIEKKALTYNELTEQLEHLLSEFKDLQNQIASKQQIATKDDQPVDDLDSLDVYMTNLSSVIVDKKDLHKNKARLMELEKEISQVKKLIDIVKPVNLPPLAETKEVQTKNMRLPLIGKRIIPKKSKKLTLLLEDKPVAAEKEFEEDEEDDEEEQKIEEIVEGLKDNNERRKTEEIVSNLNEIDKNISSTQPSNNVTSAVDDVGISQDRTCKNIINENLMASTEESPSSSSPVKVIGPSLPSDIRSLSKGKLKKKARKRAHQKEKTKEEKLMKTSYDTNDPNISMWVPPDGQSGDGRTKLNEKFGY